jgi:hypothetical protein
MEWVGQGECINKRPAQEESIRQEEEERGEETGSTEL